MTPMAHQRPVGVLERKLAAALDGPAGPRAEEHLLAAVSGGPDSTALLAGLAALAPARGVRVTAAYVDHGLRGTEGAAERARVAATALVEIHAADAESLARALSALRDSGMEIRVVQTTEASPAAPLPSTP